jgi:ABC-2 type transport system ATP-binding protein
MIELRKVTKRFGRRTAVDAVSLRVAPGEIYGLLGHNGAGKSTIIGMLLGQVWPTAGEVMVCGCDITANRRQALRRVGAIFETPAFYEELSGWRNLQVLSGYTAKTPPERLREVLSWVGLTGREDSRVKTYSHGMRTRLALAQALLPAPALLILDEPGDGLDPEGIHELRETIRRLHREQGLTILLSSHLLHEVEQLCTRIAVLRQGRLVYEGALPLANGSQGWVRLRTDDFPKAEARLREAGLVIRSRENRLLELAPGAAIPEVVRTLVGQGRAVHEIAPVEVTLEEFYLSLSHSGVKPQGA